MKGICSASASQTGRLWKGPRCYSQRAARSAQTCGNGSRAKRDEKGGIINDPRSEESSVPGVYVAGDASRDVLLVAVTIAEGAKAAVAINRSFLKEDVLG
jgi:thioredoxin reductase